MSRYPDMSEGLAALGIATLEATASEAIWGSIPRESEYDLTHQSHFGSVSYWHAMVDPGSEIPEFSPESPVGMMAHKRAAIVFRAKIANRVIELANTAFNSTYCRKRFHYLGQALHTIQDSWSASHVARSDDSKIASFQSYTAQDHARHGTADLAVGSREHNMAQFHSRLFLHHALCSKSQSEMVAQLRHFMDAAVLPLAERVRMGGSEDVFK